MFIVIGSALFKTLLIGQSSCLMNSFTFYFRGILQIPIWFGLWIIIESFKNLNSSLIWWMTVSWTMMPHLILYISFLTVNFMSIIAKLQWHMDMKLYISQLKRCTKVCVSDHGFDNKKTAAQINCFTKDL